MPKVKYEDILKAGLKGDSKNLNLAKRLAKGLKKNFETEINKALDKSNCRDLAAGLDHKDKNIQKKIKQKAKYFPTNSFTLEERIKIWDENED